MDPLYQQIVGLGPLNEQDQAVGQQLLDAIAQRRARAARPTTYGIGAIFKGLADSAQARQEDQLRQQRADISKQMAATRNDFLTGLNTAQQGGSDGTLQPPPSPAAQFGGAEFSGGGMPRPPSPQDVQGLSNAAMLSGDPTLTHYAQTAPEMALKQQQLPGMLLQQALEKQRLEQGGPRTALGGLTQAEYDAITKREQVPKVASDMFGRYNARNGQPIETPESGGVAQLMTPEATDMAARVYLGTGQLPNMGRGNPLIHGAVLKRAAELVNGGNPLAARSNYKADSAALQKLRAQEAAVNAFEGAAMGNLNTFLKQVEQVPDIGIPLLNKPIRYIDQKVLGSPEMTAFNVARQVAVNEIAKVLNNPGLGGAALSDSARHEVEGLIGPDATLAQIRRAAEILVSDMHTRKGAVAAEIAEVQKRIGDAGGEQQAAPAAMPIAAPAGRKKRYNQSTGKIEEY